MIEYTWCPGECDSRVAVIDGTGVNFCCEPCWKTYWDVATAGLMHSDREPEDFGHSAQCGGRQRVRAGEPVVTGRDFQVLGKVPTSVQNPD